MVFVTAGALPFLLGGHGAAAASQCPCSLFGSATPSLLDLSVADGRSGDGLSYEMGVRIAVTAPARLTAIRFYKDSLETGTHTGRIWDASGHELAEVPFQSETTSGWQSAPLSTPLELEPGQTYTVSVNINAYFVDQYDALDNEIVSGPIGSIADGNNGVFAGAAGDYPTSSYRSSNYFVDVVVDDASNTSGSTTTTTATSTTDTTTGATTDTTTTTAPTTGTTTDTTTTPTTGATTTTPTTTTMSIASTTTAMTTTTTTSETTTTTPTAASSKSSGPTNGKAGSVPEVAVNPVASIDAAKTLAAVVTVSTTTSLLPHALAMPRSPLRVWFTLSALSPAPAKLQFAETPLRPWAWRPFRSEITVRTRVHSIWIRFANASGDLSDWRQLSIP